MCIVKGCFFSISWLYTNLDIFGRNWIVNKKNYHFGKIYAVCHSMGKKIFRQPFANIPIFAAKVCAWNFFKMNLHPEGLIFGYFWLQKWIPRPKKTLVPIFMHSAAIHVATNFLKSGGKIFLLWPKFYIAITREMLKQFQNFCFYSSSFFILLVTKIWLQKYGYKKSWKFQIKHGMTQKDGTGMHQGQQKTSGKT